MAGVDLPVVLRHARDRQLIGFARQVIIYGAFNQGAIFIDARLLAISGRTVFLCPGDDRKTSATQQHSDQA
jgi:hypothetical protein